MTTLYFRDSSSDKVYQAELVSAGMDTFNVQFAYGRRGSTLTTGIKNSTPLPRTEAEKVLDRLLREKLGKGYTPGEDGTAYRATTSEERFTGVLPMLLNAISENELGMYMDKPNWAVQQKFDGVCMLLRINPDHTVEAVNRKGLLVGAPECILKEAAQITPGVPPIIIDGECVGEIFYAFDYIMEAPLRDRLVRRQNTLNIPGLKHIVKVPTFYAQTWAFLDLMRERNAEGIVLKNLDSMYRPGRPASYGPALKFKFTASATCMVRERSPMKRSVGLDVWNGKGELIDVGNVTIPQNASFPQVGNVVEVRYLYAFKGGCLFQPVYLGPRDDVEVDQYDSLKFKSATEEDDEA